MYVFPVERLYLLDEVQSNPFALARARRLMAGLGVSDPTVVSRRELGSLRVSWQESLPSAFPRRTGSFDYSRGWTVVLDTIKDSADLQATYRDGANQMGGDGVCRSALELHGAFGCSHRCQYCHVSPTFLIGCDLEFLAEQIPEYCARYPEQRLFKFDNCTDTVALEPEYGASSLLIPTFAKTEDRYLLLYTKSDNVDHLLGLHHGGLTIINWSLSPLTQSRQIEVNTPDTLARIAAMHKCAAAGYTVRCRISPIVPIEGWQSEFVQMADALFSAVTPDVVTIDVIGWCQPEALAAALDVSRLEVTFSRAVQSSAGTGNRTAQKYLFPHDLRLAVLRYAAAQLRRRAPDVPVALCNETRRMWRDLSDVLRMTPSNYACCCGPDSVPGHPMLLKTPGAEQAGGG